MTEPSPRRPKHTDFVYLAGPLDAMAAYRRWRDRTSEQQYFGTVFLDYVLDLCSREKLELLIVTTNPGEATEERIDWCTVRNCPLPSDSAGVAYHARSLWWLVRLLPAIIARRPSIVLATAARHYYFGLLPLKLFGIAIVPALLCTIRPKFQKTKLSWRILETINVPFYRWACSDLMVMSYDIKSMLQARYGIAESRFHEFLPTYPRSRFDAYRPNSLSEKPFVILFCGRIEWNKGVFDLLTIARRLASTHPGAFRFHFCGTGSQLESLRKSVIEENLQNNVIVHGQCNVGQLNQLIEESHIFVVPTRTDFEEGFNMVCAEGVMALRPVVTSAVCPALHYIRECAVEVRPDNVDDYHAAILSLYQDEALYLEKVEACYTAREQFFDESRSYGAALNRVATKLLS